MSNVVTAAVWKEINAIPPRAQGLQSVRGRAHDVLWMAAMAAREGGRSVTFTMQMGVGRTKWQEYRIVMSPEGPGGAACVTIMKPRGELTAATPIDGWVITAGPARSPVERPPRDPVDFRRNRRRRALPATRCAASRGAASVGRQVCAGGTGLHGRRPLVGGIRQPGAAGPGVVE
jgi:hypothetical protein